LPEPESRPDLEEAYEAPRDELEVALAEVWGEVLRVDRVGVHDNFFELGGDSILSIQVVARAAERGLRLSSRQLFQHQSIARLRPGPAGAGRAPPGGGRGLLAGAGGGPGAGARGRPAAGAEHVLPGVGGAAARLRGRRGPAGPGRALAGRRPA